MSSFSTNLSLYASGYPGRGSTLSQDVTGLTQQRHVGRSARQWSEITKIDVPNYDLKSRLISVTTPTGPADFVSFNVKHQNPPQNQYGDWADWVVDIYNPSRRWDPQYRNWIARYSDYEPLNDIGIAIRMENYGNDIVIPNGRGMYYRGHEGGLRYSPMTDYHYTFTTVQNGEDSVIGGFGPDYILSESLTYVEAVERNSKKFNTSRSNNIRGSKLFVGGSDDDFLSGGMEGDLLVGDRLNGYELYLNREALDSNIPDSVVNNRRRLLNYQPPDYNNVKNTDNPRDNTFPFFGLGKFTDLEEPIFGKSQWLWRPGNDVIHGNGGADTIYGDGNGEQELYELFRYKQAASDRGKSILPPGKGDWSKIRIGADFIDGGDGNDVIYGGFGSDAIIGGYGSDIIYTGDQIIAEKYEPVWGPKVIWGGGYQQSDESPDLFVLGNLFTDEDQMDSRIQDVKNQQAISQAVTNKWLGVVSAVASAVASKVTDGLSDLFLTLFDIFTADTSTASSAKPPNALDGLTIIRDFGDKDVLMLKIRNDELMVGSKAPLEAPTSNKYDYNPLVGSGAKGKGVRVDYTPKAGSSFAHLFLEGYDKPLYVLGRVDRDTRPDTDGTYLLLGGAEYSRYNDYQSWF
jgi:hypothetical protein